MYAQTADFFRTTKRNSNDAVVVHPGCGCDSSVSAVNIHEIEFERSCDAQNSWIASVAAARRRVPEYHQKRWLIWTPVSQIKIFPPVNINIDGSVYFKRHVWEELERRWMG